LRVENSVQSYEPVGEPGDEWFWNFCTHSPPPTVPTPPPAMRCIYSHGVCQSKTYAHASDTCDFALTGTCTLVAVPCTNYRLDYDWIYLGPAECRCDYRSTNPVPGTRKAC
jgi:hypothetical protein